MTSIAPNHHTTSSISGRSDNRQTSQCARADRHLYFGNKNCKTVLPNDGQPARTRNVEWLSLRSIAGDISRSIRMFVGNDESCGPCQPRNWRRIAKPYLASGMCHLISARRDFAGKTGRRSVADCVNGFDGGRSPVMRRGVEETEIEDAEETSSVCAIIANGNSRRNRLQGQHSGCSAFRRY